jgi:hypothetical protein
MATKTEDALFRPYAPTANVVGVLQRVRRMNMPSKVSREFLVGAGISENIVPRVAGALRFLRLIDDQDAPSDALRALASGTEDEYKQLLARTIQTAYATDFQNIAPATDSQQKISDTFQRYTPKSQHARQVILLLGLCREAGMDVLDSPRERQMQTRRKTNRSSVQSQQKGRGQDTKPTDTRSSGASTPSAAGLLFGVTEDDIAALPSGEFNEVWAALGKIALARARAKKQAMEQATSAQDEESEDDDT